MRNDQLLQEAAKLAKDGELGNSNAIRLLQIPHAPEDLKEVLATFDQQLTREARSKLSLGVYAPLPDRAENQRYEPIFDRHPISGRTYTTASGTVVPNEVQYYNGEMVQLYGECTNVAAVFDALAGSGYKPLTIRYANGQETAIAHFWCHNLSDTSLRPYNAMFIIVAAVPENARAGEACLTGDQNGASSVMSVVDGSFDRATSVYENRARFYYYRLLDSTRVAIEVGRERMGTDKRPGTIQLSHTGRQLAFSVRDGVGHGVADINVSLTDDRTACRADIATAAATAGVSLGEYPPGAEYVYPSVSRIGTGPIVQWQWRTDLQPRLQPALPSTAVFHSSSEEGATLIHWGFRPKVLGYLPNVRGVVTGVPDAASSRQLKVRITQSQSPVTLHPKWR